MCIVGTCAGAFADHWTIGGLRIRDSGDLRDFSLHGLRMLAHDEDVPLDGVVFPWRPHRHGCVADFDAGHGELLPNHRLQPADARPGGTMPCSRSVQGRFSFAFIGIVDLRPVSLAAR